MARSRFAFICMICSAAIMSAIDFAIRTTDRFLAFIFGAVNQGPAFSLAGAGGQSWAGTRLTFADPHIERHEAGQSRRSAARGI
jgi:hypothetical protein